MKSYIGCNELLVVDTCSFTSGRILWLDTIFSFIFLSKLPLFVPSALGIARAANIIGHKQFILKNRKVWSLKVVASDTIFYPPTPTPNNYPQNLNITWIVKMLRVLLPHILLYIPTCFPISGEIYRKYQAAYLCSKPIPILVNFCLFILHSLWGKAIQLINFCWIFHHRDSFLSQLLFLLLPQLNRKELV